MLNVVVTSVIDFLAASKVATLPGFLEAMGRCESPLRQKVGAVGMQPQKHRCHHTPSIAHHPWTMFPLVPYTPM